MKYRAEIDGLRALAVLPVILFHAGFDSFSGGFVGVDVFFVVSGYLITTIIVSELAAERFSIANFYERRARRILPALFFVMLVCLPFSWFWLTASDLDHFGQSLVAVATFSSNFLFWSESGYFDTAAELKPLLHTWSLAVEEQYYILFPIFLALVWRWGPKPIVAILALVFVVSLGVAHWSTTTEVDPRLRSGAFFLLPARGWELLIGVFASLALMYGSHLKSLKVNQALSLTGIGMIVYAVVAFDKNTPFPSLYALIPSVGTVLVILCAVPNTVVHRLLSTAPLVGIGLVSYSAYLWHQPVLAFARHKILGEPSNLLLILLCAASIAMAYVSWRWVEQPFRDRQRTSRSVVVGFSAAGIAFFGTLGLFVYVQNGFAVPEVQTARNTAPVNVDGKVMLIGDSHANHLRHGLSEYFGEQLVLKVSPGCIPLLDIDRYDYRFKKGVCAQRMTAALNEFMNDDGFEVLILSHMGPVYLDDTTFRGKHPERLIQSGVVDVKNANTTDRWTIFEEKLLETLGRLSELENKQVVYFIDIPELGIEGGDCSWRIDRHVAGITFRVRDDASVMEFCRISRSEFDDRVGRYHRLLADVSEQFPRITFVNPTPLFCDEQFCYGIRDERNLYRDVDHLSPHGSEIVADLIVKELVDAGRRDGASVR
ncbi:MAG: acyltransferase family protein [Pseudomonadota bacterium]